MYQWSQNTIIHTNCTNEPVKRAIARLKRDMHVALLNTTEEGKALTSIEIKILPECFNRPEAYRIDFEQDTMHVVATDDLGVIYALNFLSEEFLKIQPFWFWNDQVFNKKAYVEIPKKIYTSILPKVEYRGWFINDEVLLMAWQLDGSYEKSWEMVFEALLRCGGNMVIPGTDHNSKYYRQLAHDMGLWVTQHHAEPLGAEMFARVYPDLEPSYAVHSDLFKGLWKKAIEEQKDMEVIWNLGFRGQGDRPFWMDDAQYKTPEARGRLISSLIDIQYNMIKEEIKDPICCTNLYGEIMELYKEGWLKLPSDIILVWADNGYGKMVSRRQGNHNPRVEALPKNKESGKHGIYYHASFYDLQAANHITMLPNSMEFVEQELNKAFDSGCKDFLVVNASNIKPHVFVLHMIKEIWQNGQIDIEREYMNYVRNYFDLQTEKLEIEQIKKLVSCFTDYAKATVKFGAYEDERGGEQFYHYTTRAFCHRWILGQYKETVENLKWATGNIDFEAQIRWYTKRCEEALERFKALDEVCETVKNTLEDHAKELFEDSIGLQVRIHLESLKGSIMFAKAYAYFISHEYPTAFVAVGKAMAYYQNAVDRLYRAEHGKWIGFYQNECLTDMKQTVYLLNGVRHFIRNKAEGPHFYEWQRRYMSSENERKVVLITNWTNHPKDEEIYQAMKKHPDFQEVTALNINNKNENM